MTDQERSQAVYEKMNGEMKAFADSLLKLTPGEVLNHALEYVTKFDILSTMQETTLSEAQARALLSCDAPLEEVYRLYHKWDTGTSDLMTEAICERADKLVEEHRATAAIPVYPDSVTEARNADMLETYRQSHRLNVQCKNAIEEAISTHYRNNTLDVEAVRQVVERFGTPRTQFVLANTIQHKSWDGRFTPDNKAWAESIPILPDLDAWGDDRRRDYVVNSHPGLTDVFLTALRREERQKVRPSLREKLATGQRKNAPNHSAHSKGQER